MFFSVATKNLNWEILTKNLVTFKRWVEIKDEKFSYYGVHWKIEFLEGGSRKLIYRWGITRKGMEGDRTVCRFKGGGGGLGIGQERFKKIAVKDFNHIFVSIRITHSEVFYKRICSSKFRL